MNGAVTGSTRTRAARQLADGASGATASGAGDAGKASGLSLGSAPIQYKLFAMMQKPVAANHTMATPTKPVNANHHALYTIDSTDAIEMLIPTARYMRRSRYHWSVCMKYHADAASGPASLASPDPGPAPSDT